jgi:Protein of unknown function (DUF433)
MSIDEILADYGDLEREDVLAALAFAARLSQIKRVEPITWASYTMRLRSHLTSVYCLAHLTKLFYILERRVFGLHQIPERWIAHSDPSPTRQKPAFPFTIM